MDSVSRSWAGDRRAVPQHRTTARSLALSAAMAVASGRGIWLSGESLQVRTLPMRELSRESEQHQLRRMWWVRDIVPRTIARDHRAHPQHRSEFRTDAVRTHGAGGYGRVSHAWHTPFRRFRFGDHAVSAGRSYLQRDVSAGFRGYRPIRLPHGQCGRCVDGRSSHRNQHEIHTQPRFHVLREDDHVDRRTASAWSALQHPLWRVIRVGIVQPGEP